MKLVLALALGLTACEGGAPAVPDGPPQPDGPCGVTVAGNLLDWDSTAAAPAPIAGAQLTDRDDATRVATTGADGTFSLCVPSGNFSIVDVAKPSGSDVFPMMLFANLPAIRAGAMPSLRTMTAARRDAVFPIDTAYDPNLAEVLVHFSGPGAVGGGQASLATAPGLPVEGYVAEAWAAGDTGTYVFFGNVSLGTTNNTLVSSTTAGVVGDSFPIPLVAGEITALELYVP